MAGLQLKSIIPEETRVTVSSTFDKSTGKKNLLDGEPETCWSSQQGLPQHIHFVFPHEIPATHVALTFQGGFSGTAAGVWIATGPPGGKQRTKVDLGLVFGGKIHPQDGNARQVFEIPMPPDAEDASATSDPTPHKEWVKELKIVFEKSADPWGRIVVYGVEILGDGATMATSA